MGFIKHQPKSAPAIGTRISILNGQILSSTGVSSLDELFGGGIPTGRILLIKTDRYTGYGSLLLNIIAQGIAHEHIISLTSMDQNCEEVFSELMGVVQANTESKIEDSNDNDDQVITLITGVAGMRPLGALRQSQARNEKNSSMNIAWRYQKLPKFSTGLSSDFKGPNNSTYCHTFDLTKRIDEAILNNAMLSMNGIHNLESGESIYENLFLKLEKEITEFELSNGEPKKVLRIAINAIASPAWGDNSLNLVVLFFKRLRSLVRGKSVIVVSTFPAYLYNDFHNKSVNPLVRRIAHIVDGVLEVESFAGTPNPVDEKYTADYHGLIHPAKIFPVETSINTTRLPNVQLNSLGFKVRRKRFLIETFTLPPEEYEDSDPKRSAPSKKISVGEGGCSAGKTSSDRLSF